MISRRFSTVLELPTHEGGPSFSARGPRGAFDLNPFINVDLFEMTGPVFAPHPHAGFSAVTYMFDDSTTRFHNLDSLGDDSLIEPGGVHWTVTGSGIIHEEVVEETGRLGHGAQIFVRLPPDAEEVVPYGMHLTPSELPAVETEGGGRLRVVAGQLGDERSPVREATNSQVYDLTLPADAFVELTIAPTMRGFFMTVRGDALLLLDADEARLGPSGLAVFEPGDGSIGVMAGPEGVAVLVGYGVPLQSPAYMHGGFCLSTQDRVVDAVGRYRRGEMAGAFAGRAGEDGRR